MKKLILAVLLCVALLAVIPAQAQEQTTITYGETVTGEYVDTPLTFVFDGKAGEVVFISFGAETFESSLSSPRITWTSPSGETLLDMESFSTAEGFILLPEEGAYTVDASAMSGGAYQFTVLNLPVLALGDSVSGSMSNEENNYYAIITDEPFTLTYEKTSGDFTPQVSIVTVADFGLETSAALFGGELVGGTLNVEPAAETVYMIRLGEALFDFNFNAVNADYTLSLGELN